MHFPVGAAIGFQAFKNLRAIMEHRGGGMQGKRPKGLDAGIVPALVAAPIHDEHVVGEHFAKAQVVPVGLLLGGGGQVHFDFHGGTLPFYVCCRLGNRSGGLFCRERDEAGISFRLFFFPASKGLGCFDAVGFLKLQKLHGVLAHFVFENLARRVGGEGVHELDITRGFMPGHVIAHKLF